MNEHLDASSQNATTPRQDCTQASREANASSSAKESDDRKAAGRKVLIADDNRDSAESIAMIFRIYGHDVAVVYDGEAAVATFAAFEPSFVLLDIGMPRLNGYEAAKRIRAAAGTRPVTLVALTGWGQESDKERAFAAGFDHHFTKPVDPERLGALITA
jgi:CheY-like chemotaxis protein